jgi:energy-converting hydrogenase Eha subunit H
MKFGDLHGSQANGWVVQVAYTFGLSEWEIFWPLVAGATLILAPPGWWRASPEMGEFFIPKL